MTAGRRLSLLYLLLIVVGLWWYLIGEPASRRSAQPEEPSPYGGREGYTERRVRVGGRYALEARR